MKGECMNIFSSRYKLFFAASSLYLCCSLIAAGAGAIENKVSANNTPVTSTEVPTANTAISTNAPQDSSLVETDPAASAQTNSPATTFKPAPQKISGTSQLASLLGGLALILVLIFGLSWFVKKFSQGGLMQNPTIKMVSAMPLGTRERLMLVDVGGKQLLLGVTATQINTLHVFDEPVVILTDKAQSAPSDFSQKLMAILQQKNLQQTNNSSDKNSSR
jgi:flagellar protein FliO/FliZ